MEELVKMIEEMGIPFAYDHFAEGEILVSESGFTSTVGVIVNGFQELVKG